MGGQVRYIVALDYEHHIFMSEWAKAYPEAKLIGPEGLPEKRGKANDPKIGSEDFAVVFKKQGKRDIRIDPEFDADFEYEYVDGHANLELVFFYKPDKVLIEADLLFNLPAHEQYSKVPEAEKKEGTIGKMFSGVQSPEGDVTWMRRLTWYLLAKDRASFNESVRLIYKWDFDTLIPCHGDVAEGNGKELFHKVFLWHLEGKK
jgi:glyoxylase-like metal-dependent hydrolase (beta-lactamase superfamily II)